jgi:5-oxoprolinase (ATP-hydrolysing) subunit A
MILDLNCDLGEGCSQDADLMPLITSANVACGFHAGDAPTALATLRLAAQHGVRVGAHPGFPDREHFGRRELERSADDVLADCIYQIAALTGLAGLAGTNVGYIKPHGALYNMAVRDVGMAFPLVKAAEKTGLPILGLPGSTLEAICKGRVQFVAEGYADRRYRLDGSLVPRTEADAFVRTPAEGAAQAISLLRRGAIRTLCVHGDNPQAIAFVREVRAALIGEGVEIRSFA